MNTVTLGDPRTYMWAIADLGDGPDVIQYECVAEFLAELVCSADRVTELRPSDEDYDRVCEHLKLETSPKRVFSMVNVQTMFFALQCDF